MWTKNAEMDKGAGLHHRIRHQWLTRYRALAVESAELRASGRSDSFDHRGDRSLLAMRIDAAMSFGGSLLFEVEAFRAEEFSSSEEARGLITECANIALAESLSHFEQAMEMRRHPEWRPELSEIVRDAHRHTISALEPDVTTDEPVPPFRRRMTVKEHAAVLEEVERRYDRYPATMGGYAHEYLDLVDELPAYGVDRVLALHPWMERFGCETDVTFLVARQYDWIQLEGFLASPTLDWFFRIHDDGEWAAYNWPPRPS
ncbi:hypothetical protein [Amycolatopsis sp. YIM 10]|uniref:hypothetical protein n=1 Tax=Amycolatopsis sp. YIM 10 TaxID=2653857 RepID=UPI001290424B|nr:hypothetical protein [Amycolatopsis sp. YIM 10]QFU92057.1 hypothetical protein YIM_34480 [Amycolatopsis sp. YIM 10]